MTRSLLTGLIAASAIFFGVSCKKENNAVTGRWNIINDSTFAGVGLGNHSVNYKGHAGDYFDFTPGGYLYIKEDGNFNKLNYTLISDTKIVINSFSIALNGVPETCLITNLTNHTLTITAPFVATPGGIFGRKVNLKR